MDRLETVQNLLFENQTRMNKSIENTYLNVLVENFTEDKTQVFGRSEYMTSVMFNGNKSDIGKIVQVKIKRSNRSTLFGEKISNSNQKVAQQLSGSIKKNINSSLKFVYSDNNSISVIFHNNDLLMGVVGEFKIGRAHV